MRHSFKVMHDEVYTVKVRISPGWARWVGEKIWHERDLIMDFSQSHIFLSHLPAYIFYTLVVGSAISLFLIFYIRNLILQAKKGDVVKSASLPVWLTFMYPNWLDKLTFQHIFKAFTWGLGIAIVSWIILAILFLIVITKVYGP